MSDGDYKVYGGPFNVSVAYVTNGLPNGIANADFAPHMGGDGRWWLARVVVKDGKGKGVGTEMLRLLKEELVKNENFTDLLVAPGGYGSDPKRQRDFYLKNGFVPESGGGLLWRPQEPRPRG
jgi:GNAT superfamily N-acetyltransferase